MSAQLSADGSRIEGTTFPDPTPPSSTTRFAVDRGEIIALQEAYYDDATGTGNVAKVCIIWFTGGNVVVADDIDALMDMWNAAPPQ